MKSSVWSRAVRKGARECSDFGMRIEELERRAQAIQPLFGVCQGLSTAEFTKLNAEWDYFVRRKQSLVSLEQLLPVQGEAPNSKLIISLARYVYHEIPIRLAHRGRDLDRLPYGLSHMEPIREVHKWYFQSFVAMRQAEEPNTIEDCIKLLPVLRDILERHGRTLEHAARGIYHLKQVLRPATDLNPHFFAKEPRRKDKGWWLHNFPRLQTFLNTFNESRIGTRFLIAHLYELLLQVGETEGWLGSEFHGFRYSLFNHDPETFVGLMNKDMDPVKVVEHAVSQVSKEAVDVYGASPAIDINLCGKPQNVLFVPLYLNTMCTELLKNSVRAVIETHGRYGSLNGGAKIKVDICVSQGRLTLRVSDEGGGIKRSHIDLAQSYLYTTAPPAYADPSALDVQKPWESSGSVYPDAPPLSSVPCSASPFAGYGYGLPITKCISKYFGGDFEIASQEGLGTSTYIYLQPNHSTRLC